MARTSTTFTSQVLLCRLEREHARALTNPLLRTRLEVVLCVLRGEPTEIVGSQYGLSVPTIQNWLCAISKGGAPALSEIGSQGRPSRLTQRQLTRLAIDLKKPPALFGYSHNRWNGPLLSRHIASRYGVSLSVRRCREYLRKSGNRSAVPTLVINRQPPNELTKSDERTSSKRRRFLTDHELKRRALRRIQRLGSSGLPLIPFARNLFENFSEAVPHAEHETLLLDRWFKKAVVVNHPSEHIPRQFRKLVFSPEQESGFRLFPLVFACQKPIFRFQELKLMNYASGRMRSEVFVPFGVEDSILAVLRRHGEVIGYYPIDRDGSMRPFSADDELFVRATVPHIASGLESALAKKDAPSKANSFVKGSGFSEGIVLLQMDGRVLALDDTAHAIFRRVGVLDDIPRDIFAANNMKSAFDYIARTLRSIFFDGGEVEFSLGAPVACVYSHRTGIALKLRGFLTAAERERYFTIIVEEGETEELYRKRLMYRFGLSAHEFVVLRMIAEKLRPKEISAAMNVSRDTVKTYFRRIIEKLNLEGQSGLLRFADLNFVPRQTRRDVNVS